MQNSNGSCTDPNVQLSIALETYHRMLYFTDKEKDDIYFINGAANGNYLEDR